MPNTPRGYPYPVLTDAAAVPQHIQSLAQAVDNDLGSNFFPTTYIRLARSTNYTLFGDDVWHPIAAWYDGIQKRVGNIGYVASGLVQINVAGEYQWQFSVAWPAQDPSNPGFRQYGTVLLGRNGATPAELISAGGWPVGAGKNVDIVPPGGWGGLDTTYTGTIPAQSGDLLQAAIRKSNPPTETPTPYVFIVRRVA